MKPLLLATVAALLTVNVAAEECVPEPNSSRVEKCTARVDDVIRVNVDGYVAQHYIVQYHGQRLVVFDPPAQTSLAVGDQVSFIVFKLEEPAGSRSQGFRALLAQTSFGPEPSSEKSRP